MIWELSLTDVAKEIRSKATLKHVNFARIAEIYPKVKLASVATIRALAEVLKMVLANMCIMDLIVLGNYSRIRLCLSHTKSHGCI